MRFVSTAVISVVFGLGLATGWTLTDSEAAREAQFDRCGLSSTSQLRTTL